MDDTKKLPQKGDKRAEIWEKLVTNFHIAGMKTEVPQLEDGYFRVATEIGKYLAKTYMSSYESQILWAIFVKTYGFHKKEDWVSNSQFAEITGMLKPHISRTIKKLIERKIVTQIGKKIAFQKDWTLWRELPKQVKVTQTGFLLPKQVQPLPKQVTTKDTYTKDTIQKIYTPTSKFPKSYLEQLPEKDINEFYKKYEVTHDVVKMTAQKIILYCESKGRIYKNYRSTLQNWLLEKYGFRKTPLKEKFDYVYDQTSGKYLQVKKQV